MASAAAATPCDAGKCLRWGPVSAGPHRRRSHSASGRPVQRCMLVGQRPLSTKEGAWVCSCQRPHNKCAEAILYSSRSRGSLLRSPRSERIGRPSPARDAWDCWIFCDIINCASCTASCRPLMVTLRSPVPGTTSPLSEILIRTRQVCKQTKQHK